MIIKIVKIFGNNTINGISVVTFLKKFLKFIIKVVFNNKKSLCRLKEIYRLSSIPDIIKKIIINKYLKKFVSSVVYT